MLRMERKAALAAVLGGVLCAIGLSDASQAADGEASAIAALRENAGGFAFAPGLPFWVNDNRRGISEVFNGDGTSTSVVVTIPGPVGSPAGFVSAPTGIIWNPTAFMPTSFAISQNGKSGVAIFIFDSDDGVISGWNPNVASDHAVVAIDNSAEGAIYKGLAFGTAKANGANIYTANFHAGTIDVFDSSFKPVATAGGFKDDRIPAGFAPFNVQNIDGALWVAYAKQDGARADSVPGPGLGFVDVYDTDGNLLRRFAGGGPLNSPWGLARAPSSWGRFAGRIVIGNFGDGNLNVYDDNGVFLGHPLKADGQPLVIPGLWALAPGGGTASTPESMYYTSAPDNGGYGLFCFIDTVPVDPANPAGDVHFEQGNLGSAIKGN
jgi:uncharacterized protein (TIGR03118 family)